MILGLDAPWFALTMVIAIFGFLLSSTFGIGGALLLIPVLAQRMPAAHAVAIAAPIMLFNNVVKTWVFRKDVNLRATALVSGLAMPCAFLAALVSARTDDRVLLLAVAFLTLASLAVERGFGRTVKMSDRSLLLWGGFTGVVSGFCGAAGPPTAIGLKGYGLTREAFVGTVSAYAVLLQIVKIPAYVSAGAFPVERMPLALLLSFFAFLSVLVAPALLKRMPQRVFALALDALLVVSAVWLIVDVIRRSL